MPDTALQVPPIWDEIRSEFDEKVVRIEDEQTSVVERCQKAALLCIDVLTRLHLAMGASDWKGRVELSYYKDVRPYYLSHLNYFDAIYQVEISRPLGGPDHQDAYLRAHLKTLRAFFRTHHFFFEYLRSEAHHLDDQLFFRPPAGSPSALYGYLAPPSPTLGHICHDFLFAQILSAERQQKYILSALHALAAGTTPELSAGPRMVWTDSKTGLIELAYALQSAGVLNHGKVALKEIINLLQRTFHTQLGNYPRTFQEILSRKNGYTTLIDKLREKLLLRIETIEEKY